MVGSRPENRSDNRSDNKRPSTLLEVPVVRKRSLRVAPAVAALLVSLLAATAAQAAPPFETVDAQLLDLAAAYPGFGGLFLDESGKLNVYLTDDARRAGTMEKALGAEVRAIRGDYRIEELLGWRDRLRSLLSLPTVTMLDADEARNRVVVGVEPGLAPAERDGVRQALVERGVPEGAVVIEERSAIRELAAQTTTTLDDRFRPVPGGVQLVFPLEPPFFACTAGFVAKRAGVTGLVVNAHCTGTRGEVDGIGYFQSVPSDGAIGHEIADPGFFTDGDCPTGRRCRYSDSAFVQLDNAKLASLGRIARPLSNGSDEGTLTLKPASSRFSISGTGTVFTGSVVHKVGRTTGWTYGRVVATCAMVNVSGQDITHLCQTIVEAGSGGGDSGSPVFSRIGSTAKVKLDGILWGGGTDSLGNSVFAFSPITNVQGELGALIVK
jgi:hypothetical protein